MDPFWPGENPLKNDPKSLRHPDLSQNFSKMIEPGKPDNFRVAQRAPKSMAMNHLKTEITKTLYK